MPIVYHLQDHHFRITITQILRLDIELHNIVQEHFNYYYYEYDYCSHYGTNYTAPTPLI